MDIMELGAIGELMGGVVVIGSLLYVGLQVRQSNALNRAESVRAFARDYNGFLMQVKDPTFIEIWRRGSTDFHALSRTEQSQFSLVMFYHLMLGLADSTIDPHRSGDFAQFLDSAFASTVKTPGGSQWWDQFKTLMLELAPDYVGRIDAAQPPDLLASTPWFVPEDSEMGGA